MIRSFKTYLAILLIATISSCSPQPEETQGTGDPEIATYQAGEEMKAFEGGYFIGEQEEETGKITLIEACWTKNIELFEIQPFAGSPGEYFIGWDNGYRAYMYNLTSSEMRGDTLVMQAELEDEFAEERSGMPVNSDFMMYKSGSQENVWKLQLSSEYVLTLIREEDKEKYPYIACVEDIEMTEEFVQDEIIKALFILLEGGEDSIFQNMIPESGTVWESPGIGVTPRIDTLKTAEGLSTMGLFQTPVYKRLMEYVQMHVNEERSFISITDQLPDRCLPEQEGLYIVVPHMNIDIRTAKATAMLVKQNDESEEIYTYFIMNFDYDKQLRITDFSTLDCST